MIEILAGVILFWIAYVVCLAFVAVIFGR